jgi:hypothetical protein
VFSSSGNQTDSQEQLVAPNGMPELYQVGMVDSTGRTWLNGHTEEQDPFFATMGNTRPYQTGALGSFTAAGADAVNDTQHFGGTSGASPRTAGYALRLIDAARSILGAGRHNADLASLAPGATPPTRGPLADGRFTVDELTALMHHTAAPYEVASPARYLIEGYGAVNDATVTTAIRVLTGEIAEPARPDEDKAHDAVTQARRAFFQNYCG